MTAPQPAQPADVAAVLDRLDAAREHAALGSLRVGQHYGIHLYAGQEPVGTTLKAKDAALIVAAVNAQPALVAALRGVLDLAESWRYKGEHGCGPWQEGYGPGPDDAVLEGVSGELLRAVAAALGDLR